MISRKDIMYQHMIAFQGIDGKINDVNCRFLLAEEKDKAETHYDLKCIITDKSIVQGDYITIDNQLFMIIDTKKVTESSYTKGIYREVLKITFQPTQKDVYAIVDKINGVYAQGQQITEVHDQYKFVIPKASCKYTSLSTADDLLIYAGGSYDAISIDDSKEGILIITGRFNEEYNPHTYTITLNSNSETLKETSTFQIVANCMDNGSAVTSPIVTYTSSDPNIVSVDSTGLVNCKLAGNATITCTFKNVSVDLTINVEEKPSEPVISYTYNFSQSITALKKYMTTGLTTTKTIDGVADSTLHIDYSFDSVGQSLISAGKIVVTRKSDSSITIRNASVTTNTVIHLTVIDSANGSIIVDTDVALTGM